MGLFDKLFRREKVPRLTREESMLARPFRNMAVEWDGDSEDEDVVLTIPLRKDWKTKAVTAFLAVPRQKNMQLDEIGSFVWRRCDGEHTVIDLSEALCKAFKLSKREAFFSLTTFLRTLGQKDLIGFAIERKKDEAQEKESGTKAKKQRTKCCEGEG